MAPDPPLLRLLEHQPADCHELRPDQAIQLRNHFGQYLDVTRRFDGHGYTLTPAGYVGVIVLPDLQIRIDSKVPLDNLFYMLAQAYGLDVRLRQEMTALAVGDSLLEFIAGVFVNQVDRLVRQGCCCGGRCRPSQRSCLCPCGRPTVIR